MTERKRKKGRKWKKKTDGKIEKYCKKV